jgi:signal peptidase I
MRYLLGLAACLLLTAGALRRRFVLITVTGDSMMPTLAPGDRVLVRRARLGQLRRGQLVVLEMPGADGGWGTPPRGPASRRDWMVKRAAALPGDAVPESCLPEAATESPGRLVPDGKLILLGDNAAWSYDSRELGYLPGERLLGVVVRRLADDRACLFTPPVTAAANPSGRRRRSRSRREGAAWNRPPRLDRGAIAARGRSRARRSTCR